MKPRLKKIIKIATIVLLPVALQAFASVRSNKRTVKEIFVDHHSSDMYVTEDAIRRMILNNSQLSDRIGLLELDKIENLLDSHQMIEKSEVFCTIDGTLNVNIKQRQPIARVSENQQFYYMDSKGEEMPLSDSFSARVPLITGNMTEKHWKSTYELVQFINNDDFLKKNITELKIRNHGEYALRMRAANFIVIWGNLEDNELKKANLKAFYKQMEKSKNLNIYKIVNLKYANQVVCTK
ncbi:cell division protein FtsQ/DivIB [Capnocytophaga sp.]|uniref:cell division protein FtsQ/DivIB n=1 Tax=Capnocytophaga sp. TaxID=44737 RepID=UPI0026DA8B97|nr:cell division protein FtsQ/DivIB [Capnocytophaga sp.]MDO5104278.1 cell division protein FtsQ/DivIB [Capnocytophaga sp.]